MAVFWFGWAKKLKNVFTKQQADTYYLQKNSNQLQQVNGLVDFHNNIVCKQNGYVDYVDTNGPTSMINKRYLEEQTLSKTTTTPQTIASQITFTQTNEVMKFNSGTDNSAYLSGYKSNNQRIWYFGKGSTTSNNFIIGADRGDIKLEPNGNVDVNNKKIVNVAAPTNNNDVANKQYVDNQIQQQSSTLNTNINNLIKKTDYSWATINGPFNSGNTTYYRFSIDFSQPLSVIGVNVNYKDQTSFLEKSAYWHTSWAVAGSNKVSVFLFMDKNMYSDMGGTSLNIDPRKFVIRLFYIDRYNSRQNDGDIIILETGGVK